MNIQQLEVGKEYLLIHSHGQPSQKVKILDVAEISHIKWGKYWEAQVEYTSEDCTKGMVISMNTIECERYLREL